MSGSHVQVKKVKRLPLTEADLAFDMSSPRSGVTVWLDAARFTYLAWWEVVLFRVAPEWPEGCDPRRRSEWSLTEGMRVTYMSDLGWQFSPRVTVPDLAPAQAISPRSRQPWLPARRPTRRAHGLVWEPLRDGKGRSVYWSMRARQLVDRATGGKWEALVREVNGTEVVLVRDHGMSLGWRAMATILPE